MGDELTDKEKKVLRRTLTDLASVVPIGFLMLLPVSSNSLVTSVVYENVVRNYYVVGHCHRSLLQL